MPTASCSRRMEGWTDGRNYYDYRALQLSCCALKVMDGKVVRMKLVS